MLEPGKVTLQYRAYKLGKVPGKVVTKSYTITTKSSQTEEIVVEENPLSQEELDALIANSQEKKGFFGSIGHFFKCLFSKAC